MTSLKTLLGKTPNEAHDWLIQNGFTLGVTRRCYVRDEVALTLSAFFSNLCDAYRQKEEFKIDMISASDLNGGFQFFQKGANPLHEFIYTLNGEGCPDFDKLRRTIGMQ